MKPGHVPGQVSIIIRFPFCQEFGDIAFNGFGVVTKTLSPDFVSITDDGLGDRITDFGQLLFVQSTGKHKCGHFAQQN